MLKTIRVMKIKLFLKRNFYTFRIVFIFLQTILFLYAFNFAEQTLSIECIPCYFKDYRMYLALIFSFFTTLLIIYSLGGFNKENIKRITTIDKDKDE